MQEILVQDRRNYIAKRFVNERTPVHNDAMHAESSAHACQQEMQAMTQLAVLQEHIFPLAISTWTMKWLDVLNLQRILGDVGM